MEGLDGLPADGPAGCQDQAARLRETGADVRFLPADMGKVMGAASKQLAGLADGKAISAKVSELLKK